MLLKDIMTPDVATVGPETNVREAAARMAERDIGSLPVCDGRKVLGQVTDRDITIKVIAEGMNPEQVMVADIMTSPVIWAYEDMSVDEAAELMQDHQIRRLIVIDHDKNLTGIVAVGDIAVRASDALVGETVEQISKPGSSSLRY